MEKTVGLRRRECKHNDDAREDLYLARGEQADPDGSVTPGLKGAGALIFGCFVRAGGKENAERLKS